MSEGKEENRPMKKAKTEGRVLDVSSIAVPFRSEIKSLIESKYKDCPKPKLVAFMANEDKGARSYARWTKRACKADLIDFELRECKKVDLEDQLEQANEDPNVHGIMVYYPVYGAVPSFYGGSMDEYIRNCVSLDKDVEGMCHTYRHALYSDKRFIDKKNQKKSILPCTPLAIVKILEPLVYEPGTKLKGKTISIINRSEVVGHPLAAMLANDGATVYSIDIDSIFVFEKVGGRGRLLETPETAESACKKSDVIVCGVPSKSYKINLDWVKDNTVVVNVSPFKCVDVDALLKKTGCVWVPMVGKLTVAMLERNLMRLYEYQTASSASS